jgi:hypothetical protein
MRIIVGTVLVVAMTGCDPLEGRYVGALNCYAEEPYSLAAQVKFSAAEDGGYTGDGSIGFIPCGTVDSDETVDCMLRFDMEVQLESPTGEQDLNIDYSNCRYETDAFNSGADTGAPTDYDSPQTHCRDETEEVSWDGTDTIDWKRWWTDDVLCVGKLKRQ